MICEVAIIRKPPSYTCLQCNDSLEFTGTVSYTALWVSKIKRVELAVPDVVGAMFDSAVGSASDCRSRACEFESQPGLITFVEIDHEIISRLFSPFR